MAEKRIHTNINSVGDQVLILGTESKEMTELEVDGLMEALRTGKEDAKTIKASLKVIAGIRKQYNTVGKPITEEIPDEPA